jgi:hypothetical protein
VGIRKKRHDAGKIRKIIKKIKNPHLLRKRQITEKTSVTKGIFLIVYAIFPLSTFLNN